MTAGFRDHYDSLGLFFSMEERSVVPALLVQPG